MGLDAQPSKPPLEQEGVQFFQDTVGLLFADYGWYILLSFIAIYLLIQKLAKGFQGIRGPRMDATALTVLLRNLDSTPALWSNRERVCSIFCLAALRIMFALHLQFSYTHLRLILTEDEDKGAKPKALRKTLAFEGRKTDACLKPDAVVRRQEALLAARLRMQEELDAQAEKFKEKQKKVEEEKRKQKIAMWESMQEGKSFKETLKQNQEPEPGASASAAVPKPKPNRKPLQGGGYNPLSGEGGRTCSWRPGRRGPSSGG